MDKPLKCDEKVSDRDSRWPHYYPCGRKAKPGTTPPRCGIHCEEAIAARQAKRNAAWKQRDQARDRRYAIEDLRHKIVQLVLAEQYGDNLKAARKKLLALQGSV